MSVPSVTGRLWVFGDNVNTDVIFPGKYTYTLKDPQAIASHALEDLDPAFARRVQPNDIIVAGSNWGCGSSREQAVSCLVYAGVSAVIARSFSRIYYRNALNNGLLAIECPAFAECAEAGASASVSLDAATITYHKTGTRFAFKPFSPNVMRILDAGGLIPFIQRQLAAADARG